MTIKTIAYSALVLRILTLLFLVASAVCLLCNSYKLGGDKYTWKDIKTYRYVFATAVIGVVYTLFQIPFAVYYAYKEKRLIRHSCLPEFDFYADKLVSYILATGVGAGFAASMELKEYTDEVVTLLDFIRATIDLGFDIDQFHSRVDKYFHRGIITTILLTLGCVCMVIISILSSLNRSSGTKSFFG
ncbi:CASP-like protein 4D1 [Rutidosis leptorrhynchoides]|uniref:CASP-like protein 4D1 n=1 Tax=Rutidosis leptorrhynchoides TaxID=125765 RepID=UPI003A99F21B